MMKEKLVLNIQEVAKVAKVSAATVYRVLNGLSCAKEECSHKVLEAIKELGYKANNIAGSNPVGSKDYYTLGVEIPFEGKMFSSYYEMQVVKGVDTSNFLDTLTKVDMQSQHSYNRFLLLKLFGLY